MNNVYQHTQWGTVILAVFGAGVLVVLFFMIFRERSRGSYFILAALLMCGVAFSSLTITVGAGEISWFFGPGFLKKVIQLNDIKEVEAVRNPWYFGWGIRYTGDGWLYNVSGFSALQLTLRNGKKIRLGTDEPQALLDVVLEQKFAGRKRW